jgi:hypothetical protein
MPKTYDKPYFTDSLKVPECLVRRVMDTPRLLPGERCDDFFLLFEVMVGELVPASNLEWLLCIDLAWNMWDIERYRRWKHAMVAVNHRHAVEEALRLSHPQLGMSAPTPAIRAEIRKHLDAAGGDWQQDNVLSEQLAMGEYDNQALNATAFLQAASSLATIERFLASAFDRFNATLREVKVRREFKLRAEHARMRLLAEDRLLLEAKRADAN